MRFIVVFIPVCFMVLFSVSLLKIHDAFSLVLGMIIVLLLCGVFYAKFVEGVSEW